MVALTLAAKMLEKYIFTLVDLILKVRLQQLEVRTGHGPGISAVNLELYLIIHLQFGPLTQISV